MDAIDPLLRIGAVTLAVSDLERSVRFYEQVLGLPLIARERDSARLGPDRERPALVLVAIAEPTPVRPGATGLFHVAWLHRTRAELAASVRRIAARGWPLGGASDHGVSEALYLSDPDGLGIEIYADRPRAQWPRPADAGGVRMVTLPLDVEDLLACAPAQLVEAVAPGTAVGHVHLKVSDLARAVRFYAERLGFEQQATLPAAAFLSAGGYHHHLGLNTWQSAGAASPPDSAPGLRDVRFELSGAQALAALERRLEGAPGCARATPDSLQVRDPDGQLLTFAVPAEGNDAA